MTVQILVPVQVFEAVKVSREFVPARFFLDKKTFIY
jgi:hypothetical protein